VNEIFDIGKKLEARLSYLLFWFSST